MKIGLSQSQFWSPVGITQSGGSRYESGRNIPRPVQKLLVIAYGTEAQRTKIIDRLTKGGVIDCKPGNSLNIGIECLFPVTLGKD